MDTKPLLFALSLGALTLTGCASVQPRDALAPVSVDLSSRTSTEPIWRLNAEDDARADRIVDSLLAQPLTEASATQIALLSDRTLQSAYEDLAVAQADRVQAGLLANPFLSAGAGWEVGESGPPDLHLGASIPLVSWLWTGQRKAVAQSRLEASQARIAAVVLGHAADTRRAFFAVQTAQANADVMQRASANALAAYESARLLREAGNVPAVDLLAEQARYEQVRLDVLTTEADVQVQRAHFAERLGVWGERASFEIADGLPDVPAVSPADDLVERAVASNLALAAARHDVVAAARVAGAARPQALVPALEVGAEAEREDGHWEVGPDVSVALPIFDAGQARVAQARSNLRRAQAEYHALGVSVRAQAQAVQVRLAATQQAARHYREVVLPLRVRVVQATLRQYNAMQVGVFGLLQAQADELAATRAYLDARLAYWNARADADLLLAGGMPDGTATAPMSASPAAAPMRADPH